MQPDNANLLSSTASQAREVTEGSVGKTIMAEKAFDDPARMALVLS